MGTTVTELLPLGVGVIVSPMPVVTLVVLMLTARGRDNAVAFTAAAVAASAVLTATTALLGKHDVDGIGDIVHPAQVLFGTAFGVLALAFAYQTWRRRPRRSAGVRMPSWMKQLDRLDPATAALLGLVLTAPNAKNLPLVLEAGATVGAAQFPWVQTILVSAGFAVFAGAALLALTVLAAAPSKRVGAMLGVVRDELVRHNTPIVVAVSVLIAAMQLSHVAAALAA